MPDQLFYFYEPPSALEEIETDNRHQDAEIGNYQPTGRSDGQ